LPTRIIIAARTSLACQLLSRALTGSGTQFKVVGCAQTKEELLKEVSEHRPDVAVVNSLLQDDPQGGIKALRELCAAGLSVHPIVVLDKDEPEQVVEAFAAGAEGVVCSTAPFKTLCKCIRCVEAGQIWASNQELHWVLKALADWHPVRVVSALGNPLLTLRQEQIVRMVVDGLPDGEISSKLQVSPHTVKNHLFHIYEKLGVSSRVELILYAMSRSKGS
jgi:DNA-binding NarL/FixJ family response regulator